MSILYFNLEPINAEIPFNFRWLSITKNYEKPVKTKDSKLNKQQFQEYKDNVEQRNKMFKALDSGHINLYNNSINGVDINKEGIECIIDEFKTTELYYIKPIHSTIKKNNMFSKTEYKINEFEIVKKIDNVYSLLDLIIENNFEFEFLYELFDLFKTKRYDESKLIDYFSYVKEMSEKYIPLYQLLETEIGECRYLKINPEFVDNINYLINENIIDLFGEYYTNLVPYVQNLLKLKLYDILLKVFKNLNKQDLALIKNCKEFKNSILYEDKKNVSEIFEILELEKDTKTLLVMGEKNELIEEKSFKTINEIKTYIIINYDVSYEQASGNISDISFDYYHENYGISFVIK